MNIRYPIYEGVYRILTYAQPNHKNTIYNLIYNFILYLLSNN